MNRAVTHPLLLLLMLAGILLSGLAVSTVASAPPGEYEVKAAYLYNFAKFTDWPPEAFSGENSPVVFCVLGKSPFGSALDSLASKTVANRKVVVRYVGRVEDIKECHILYVAASEKPRLAHILASLPVSAVLTVSDIKDFSRAGGMIGLVTQEEKVRFQINLKAAQRARLRLSSKLLKLALEIVE